jgi:hypothetical protein
MSAPMTMPQAIGASCDTYFYQPGYAFYALPPDRGHPLQGWASRASASAPLTGSTSVPSSPASAHAGVAPGDVHEEDRPMLLGDRPPGKPGDSIQLAIGQKGPCW